MLIKFEIETPSAPNFIKVHVGGHEASLSLAEISDEHLEEICNKWKTALFENKKRQINNRGLK